MNFNSLGSFEEDFLRDCRELEISESIPVAGNILLKGEAYGRLSMRALREGSLSQVFVNELSEDNLKHLSKKLELMKTSNNISDIHQASRMNLTVGDCC